MLFLGCCIAILSILYNVWSIMQINNYQLRINQLENGNIKLKNQKLESENLKLKGE